MPKDKETLIVPATIGKIYRGENTYPNKFGPGASRKWDIYVNAPNNPDIKRVGWFMDADMTPNIKEGDEVFLTLSWNQKEGKTYYNVEGVQSSGSAPLPAPVNPPAPSVSTSTLEPIGNCPHCGGPIAMEFHKA